MMGTKWQCRKSTIRYKEKMVSSCRKYSSSHISHRNIARIISFYFEPNNSLVILYKHFINDTVEEYLLGQRGEGHRWYTRISIATEMTSTALAYRQCLEANPVHLSDIKLSALCFGSDYESKIARYKLV
jgi:hypothetical protein